MSANSPKCRKPTQDSEVSANLLGMLRTASINGTDLLLNAVSAGELADQIEALSQEANIMRARSRSLVAQLSYLQQQFDELLEMYDQLKALFVLGRDDGD